MSLNTNKLLHWSDLQKAGLGVGEVCLQMNPKWLLTRRATSSLATWLVRFLFQPHQRRRPCWKGRLYTICTFPPLESSFFFCLATSTSVWGAWGGYLPSILSLSFISLHNCAASNQWPISPSAAREMMGSDLCPHVCNLLPDMRGRKTYVGSISSARRGKIWAASALA